MLHLMAKDAPDLTFLVYIVVVVVIVVVRALMKWFSEKKDREYPERSADRRTGGRERKVHSPATDLDSFLDSLSGREAPASEPVDEPPAPPVVRPRTTGRSPQTVEPSAGVMEVTEFIEEVVAAPPPPPPPRPAARPAPPPPPSPPKAPAPIHQPVRTAAAPPGTKASRQAPVSLDQLRRRDGQRNAIVLMEVLGPPRAHKPFRRKL